MHDRELNVTDAIIEQVDAPSVIYSIPSAAFPLPMYTRASFLVVVEQIGTLQKVPVRTEEVSLVEVFGVCPRDIHTKISFWGVFAEEVSLFGLYALMNITLHTAE